MLLNNNPDTIIYLKDHYLEVYAKNGELSGKLPFPKEIVNNQEVINPENFTNLLNEFFTKMGINGRKAVIILAEELVFEKTFMEKDPQKQQENINQFLTEIPFSPENISKAQMPVKESVLVIAANRDLFQRVQDSWEEQKGEIRAITALSILGIGKVEEKLTPDQITTILNNDSIVKSGNIFTVYDTLPTYSETDESAAQEGSEFPAPQPKFMEQHKTLITYIVVLILLAGALLTTSVVFGIVQNPFKPSPKINSSNNQAAAKVDVSKITPTINPTSTSSAAATSSASTTPSATAVKKSDFTVIVLNGSGVSGQAAKVRDQLVKLGFAGIKTGNAATSTLTQTTVEFSGNIPQKTKDEIIATLEKIFTKVTPQAAEDDADYDITVTTGTEK